MEDATDPGVHSHHRTGAVQEHIAIASDQGHPIAIAGGLDRLLDGDIGEDLDHVPCRQNQDTAEAVLRSLRAQDTGDHTAALAGWTRPRLLGAPAEGVEAGVDREPRLLETDEVEVGVREAYPRLQDPADLAVILRPPTVNARDLRPLGVIADLVIEIGTEVGRIPEPGLGIPVEDSGAIPRTLAPLPLSAGGNPLAQRARKSWSCSS